MLVGWKKDDSSLWLSKSPAQTLQQALKDLDRGLMRSGNILRKSQAGSYRL